MYLFFITCNHICICMRTDVGDTEMLPSNATNETLSKLERNESIHAVQENNSDCNDVCLTPECIHTASKILKNMNADVDPCDNFYKFSCGGFSNSTIIPDNEKLVNTRIIMQDTVRKQLRNIFEEESSPYELRPFRLAKDLYKACMNKISIEKRGLQPLLDNLRKLGGWPVLEGERWNESDFNWINSVYKLRKLGYPINYFFDLKVQFDNRSTRKIHLYKANLDEEVLKNPALVQFYYKYMTHIAEVLGADSTQANTELQESLQFQIMLAKLPKIEEEHRLLMNVDTMYDFYPGIDWLEYLNTIAPQAQIDLNDTIYVLDHNYMQDLEELINKTSKRVLANYILWRAVADSIVYLTDNVQERNWIYQSELAHIMEKVQTEARWKECIDMVSDKLSISVDSMYVRTYRKELEESKKTVLKMFGDIRNEFIKILRNVEWMDEETRQKALRKADNMISYISYPDELLDDRTLDEFYEKLEINADDYLGSILNVTIFKTNTTFDVLKKPLNESEWITGMIQTGSSPFYLLRRNSIHIPAGYMQSIFFNNNRQPYVNYGIMGGSIAHEIIHGFDNTGRRYDEEGNFLHWWGKETKENYFNRTECIKEQYADYVMKAMDTKLDGQVQQKENIADYVGVKIAYYAYKESIKQNGREQKLPGLPYTPEQIFWISTANKYCGRHRPELSLFTEEHGFDVFRARAPLQNMEEFSQVFKCPIGSRMNPVKKCVVW